MYNPNDLIATFIEVKLKTPESFLKVKETLTRIGIAAKHENTLFQSCHILHKQGRYFIVSFKELFLLDGKPSDFTEDDKARRNTIANLLAEWDLVDLVDSKKSEAPQANIAQIKILPFKEKNNWNLCAKYQVGRKRKE
jgi:hypothetical protein